jgi:uncharacterized DUF497 family protein
MGNMNASPDLRKCVGFDWDEHNTRKNWEKHQIMPGECEQVFFNRPLMEGPDSEHSLQEQRYYVLGRTNDGRRVFIAFTIRGQLIRVISARDMSKRERRQYDADRERG